MKIATYYSHLNGLEFLLVHKPALWEEIQDVIGRADAKRCQTKVSKESRTKGKLFYSPPAMNKAIRRGFMAHKWGERRAASTTFDRFSFRLPDEASQYLPQLWPRTDRILYWPPQIAIDDSDADFLAATLSRTFGIPSG